MKSNKLGELQAMIAGTLAAFPDRQKRFKAIRAIQWRLRSADGRYAGLVDIAPGRPCKAVLGPVESACVFDARDNEEMKLRFYEMDLRTELSVEILPQLVKA